MRTTDSKANRLFIVLAGFFLTNALIAEFDRHKRGRVDKKAAANEQSLDQIDHKQLAAPRMPTQLHGLEGGDHAAR